MNTDVLFKPLKLKSMALPNRIVMAPMTRRFADDRSVPTEAVAEYYRRRAEGGTGLILTEGVTLAANWENLI